MSKIQITTRQEDLVFLLAFLEPAKTRVHTLGFRGVSELGECLNEPWPTNDSAQVFDHGSVGPGATKGGQARNEHCPKHRTDTPKLAALSRA